MLMLGVKKWTHFLLEKCQDNTGGHSQRYGPMFHAMIHRAKATLRSSRSCNKHSPASTCLKKSLITLIRAFTVLCGCTVRSCLLSSSDGLVWAQAPVPCFVLLKWFCLCELKQFFLLFIWPLSWMLSAPHQHPWHPLMLFNRHADHIHYTYYMTFLAFIYSFLQLAYNKCGESTQQRCNCSMPLLG